MGAIEHEVLVLRTVMDEATIWVRMNKDFMEDTVDAFVEMGTDYDDETVSFLLTPEEADLLARHLLVIARAARSVGL